MLSRVTSLGHREPRKASEESTNGRIPAVGGQLRQLCAEEREHRDGRDRAAVPGPRVVQLRDGGGPKPDSRDRRNEQTQRHNPWCTLLHYCVPCFFLPIKLHFFRVVMSLASR